MIKLREILLVEDNPADLELTLEALSQNNLVNRLIVMNDGVKALEYLRCEGEFIGRKHDNPAVILLDIKMPRMNGIEVLTAIKSDTALKSIPVVMLTSSREEPDLKKCYELGVNAYVVKPVNFLDFLDVVKNIGIFWAVLNELPDNGGHNHE